MNSRVQPEPWLRTEAGPMLRLALPVVVGELGWMAMGVVDTIMVGRLGASPIGAAGIGGILFLSVFVFGMGLLLGLDTVVAQSFGAGRLAECHRWLLHGLYLSLLLTPLLMGLMWLLAPALRLWGIHPDVLRDAGPFLETLAWSTLPLLVYACCRRYLQAMGLVKPITFALVSANLVNAVGNWILIYGKLGAPALGVVGSAWSTCAARVYMAGVLLIYIVLRERRHPTGLLHSSLALELARLRRLLALGFPAAGQIGFEMGAFAAATALAGRLVPAALAAHQISLTVASCTFMVPLGISSAGAVRVGQAIGRGDPNGAKHAGWTALMLGGAFMTLAGLALFLFPRAILRAFTNDLEVVRIGAGLLLLAALFQLFDGLQVVATGVLRGAGDTRTAMLANLGGYYLLGLPIGYALCFRGGWDVGGLWLGLTLGLIVVAIILVGMWSRMVRRLLTSPVSAVAPLVEAGVPGGRGAGSVSGPAGPPALRQHREAGQPE